MTSLFLVFVALQFIRLQNRSFAGKLHANRTLFRFCERLALRSVLTNLCACTPLVSEKIEYTWQQDGRTDQELVHNLFRSTYCTFLYRRVASGGGRE